MSEPATLAARWRRAVTAVGDRPFLTWEGPDGRVSTWTYESFDALVERTAAGLVDRGVRTGDAVHLVLANSPAFVALWLAAMRLGAWIVPSDPFATADELAGHLARTSARIGICATSRADVYRAAATATTVVAVAEDDTELVMLAGTSPIPNVRPAPLDRAAVMFTSGTTSAPKGVVITQANYAFAGDVMAAAAALTAHDRCLVVLPLFHANAQYYSFAAAISAGASVVLIAAFSASGFLAQAARHQATHASLFAAPMRMILAKQPAPEPTIALRHCWFAQNISADQHVELTRLFGCAPRQLYGMTETIPAVLSSPALDARHDAIGGPTLGCAVRIDEGDHAGEGGEIEIGGRCGVELFAEYLDDPATTTAAFTDDGWFRTRDRASLDGDGTWHFAGRDAEVLKVAGENVSTIEIEAVLSAHSDVLEAAVIGEPDEMRDEVPVAFVVAAPHVAALDLDALDQWCAERLSKVKRPRRITVVDELPRTSVGKIRKFLLRDRGDAESGHEAETRVG